MCSRWFSTRCWVSTFSWRCGSVECWPYCMLIDGDLTPQWSNQRHNRTTLFAHNLGYYSMAILSSNKNYQLVSSRSVHSWRSVNGAGRWPWSLTGLRETRSGGAALRRRGYKSLKRLTQWITLSLIAKDGGCLARSGALPSGGFGGVRPSGVSGSWTLQELHPDRRWPHGLHLQWLPQQGIRLLRQIQALLFRWQGMLFPSLTVLL